MERDRNLLFGIFAVQLRKVSPSEIMEVAAAWATDPSVDLPVRLVNAGLLDDSERNRILDLVEIAVEDQNGDATKTLEAFGGAEQIQKTFGGRLTLTEAGVLATTIIGNPPVGGELPGSIRAIHETPGRYSHVSEQGRGGMGRVLLVHDEFLGREVALKELLPGTGDTPPAKQSPARRGMSLLARFLQEARVTGQLEHPSIVPVYELGHRPDGTLYYTMKLVRGQTLQDAIRKCESLQERLQLLSHFVDICQAIAYAHSRAVIHRDLKPANIMVGEFGETVVLDWGLAKIKDNVDAHAGGIEETLRLMNLGDEEAAAQTQYGQLLGTPLYAPPEQMRGQLDLINERSDVYSLGAVLYELLTGHPPFAKSSLRELVRQVIEEPPRPIRDFAPDCPPELAAICERALEKDQADRYANASELAEDIQRFQSGALVSAHEYTPTQLIGRFVMRYRAIVATSAAAIILLLVVSGVYTISITRTNQDLSQANVDLKSSQGETEIANSQLTAANIDLEEANLEISAARDFAQREREKAEETAYRLSIENAAKLVEEHRLAAAEAILMDAPERLRLWEWGYLYAQCNPELLHIPDHVGDFAFSPDGDHVVSADENGNVFLVDIRTGDRTVTMNGHQGEISSMEFVPGEQILVTASEDSTARVWDTATGNELVTFTGHTAGITELSIHQNGEMVATGSHDGTIQLWEIKSGNLQQKFDITEYRRGIGFNYEPYPTSVDFVYDKDALVWCTNMACYLMDTSNGVSNFIISLESEDNLNEAEVSPKGDTVLVFNDGWGYLIPLTRDFASSEFNAETDLPESAKFDWDVEMFHDVDVRFLDDDERFTVARNDGSVEIWDWRGSPSKKRRISSKHSYASTAVVDPHGEIVGVAGMDGLYLLPYRGHLYRPLWERKTDVDQHTDTLIVRDSDSQIYWEFDISSAFGTSNKKRNLHVAIHPDSSIVFAGLGTHVAWFDKSSLSLLYSKDIGRGIAEVFSSATGENYGVFLRVAEEKDVQYTSDECRLYHINPSQLGVSDPNMTSIAFDGTHDPQADFVLNDEIVAVRTRNGTFLFSTSDTTLLSRENIKQSGGAYYDFGPNQAYSSDGKYFAGIGPENSLVVWDLDKREAISIPFHKDFDTLWSCMFHPLEAKLFLMNGKSVEVFDLESRSHTMTLAGHKADVLRATFSSDGQFICTVSGDSTAKIWSWPLGEVTNTLEGHTDTVVCARFSEDSQRVLTEQLSGNIRVWNAVTGKELFSIPPLEMFSSIFRFSYVKINTNREPHFGPIGGGALVAPYGLGSLQTGQDMRFSERIADWNRKRREVWFAFR